jgi:SAM-dependent methyltransferase
MEHNPQDRTNRAWYARPGSIAGMARDEGFSDAGERAAYERVAPEVRQRPILDLGVGAGRTVALLRGLSNDYLGLDYLPPMLEAARARHPDADLRLGDARDLSALPADHFALVVFSCQGLDSVDHADRHLVLEQVWRVLAPGGVFWFSTLNRDGPAARYRPWRPLPSPPPEGHGLMPALAARARAWLRVPLHMRRYRRGMALAQAGEDWAVAPFFPGGWQLLAHYTTLAGLERELARAGFLADLEVYEDAFGRRLQADDDLQPVFCFNVLARKPAG